MKSKTTKSQGRQEHNPIRSRQDWDRQRAEAASDPGAFHGSIARREIHWFDEASSAWIRWSDERGQWVGFDGKSGAALPDLRLPAEHQPWRRAFNGEEAPFFRWFEGGLTNACFNEVDAHVLGGFGDETALIYEGEAWDARRSGGRGGPEVSRPVSRKELLLQTARHALVLRRLGLRKGDRVILNLPNILDQIFYIEAAKRLGVIYTCVFGGFSAKVLADRILDSDAKVLITSDGANQSGRRIRFKEEYSDKALVDFVPATEGLEAVLHALREEKLEPSAIQVIASALRELTHGEIAVSRLEILKAVELAIGSTTSAGEAVQGRLLKAVSSFLERLGLGVRHVIVVCHLGGEAPAWVEGRDRWSHELLEAADRELVSRSGLIGGLEQVLADSSTLVRAVYETVPPVPMDADFPLFIAYTSGSTGKPKGVVHTHGGYVAGIAHTMRVSFGVAPGSGDVIYVVADPGWITGQSYMISAALTTRTTSVIMEGSPIFPHAGRFASVIERYKVSIFKAGSTFMRAVAAEKANVDDLRLYERSSLRVGTFCAEPTNPVIQQFAMTHLTPSYINSYWATEHGGIVLTHFHGNHDFELRPDAHAYPLPWVFADVWIAERATAEAQGLCQRSYRVAQPGEKGEIVITRPYPYLARTLWGDGANVCEKGWRGDIRRFAETYFERWDGADGWVYTQGDYACRYPDGSFSLHGRSDEVINTSGHRVGTEEIESAILKDKHLSTQSPVRNVIVVGAPHEEMGTVPVAFVLTQDGAHLSIEDEIRITNLVRQEKGESSIPAAFIPLRQFPETRSGKYMRRFLKAMLAGEPIGDATTLRNPECLDEIRVAIEAWRAQGAREEGEPGGAGVAEGELTRQVREATDVAARREVIQRFVTGQVAQVLSLDSSRAIDPRDLDPRRGLRESGLTSLKSMRLVNRLKAGLGPELALSLSVMTLFNRPTITELTEYLSSAVYKLGGGGRERSVAKRRLQDQPIAVIGMGCRFPGGADSPEAYWKLISRGGDAIRELPSDRWSLEGLYDENRSEPGKMYVRNGGFLDQVDQFDPAFFGISPREALALDPQQRLLLEVCWEALERGGIPSDSLTGTQTGVFVGITSREYATLVQGSREKDDLERFIPTGNNLNTASGRISYTLGLRGPSISIDTACSSALVAVHLACQSLRSGETELAFACGVNLMLTPDFTVQLCKTSALSGDGHCRTFDETADGYVRSEGCGVVLLKPLSRAIEDGDRVHAVLLGSAVNQDGKTSGLTAPNGLAQEQLIRQALANSAVTPAQVGYVEAHGTGTPLGDPIEAQAIGNVLKEGRQPANPLYLGSVKANIGHTESAAGIAGLIKAILCLEHRQIAPQLNFSKLNPNISLDQIPAVIPTSLVPWNQERRIAGVSSFGFSGTNAHVIVTESPEERNEARKDGAVERPSQLLCISAKTTESLESLARAHAEAMGAWEESRLGDACYTASACRTHFEERLAVTGRTREELQGRLRTFLSGKGGPGIVRGRVSGKGSAPKVAFLFSGQGSQYLGMSQELYGTQPGFRRSIDRCEDILRSYLKAPLREVLFGGGKGEDAGRKAVDAQDALMHRTEYTQPALFALEYSLAELWKSWGVEPQAVLGHSVGELVAACVAGVFSLEDGLKLISARAGLMQKLPGHGQMGAVSASVERVREAIAPYAKTVSIAAINAPGSVTVAGESGDLRKVLAGFEEQGVKVKLLTVSHAFHSPQMDGMLDEFEQVAGQISYRAPQIRVISNLHGRKAEGEELGQPGYWRRHVREAVRFSEGMGALLADGYRHFMEVGPGTTLSALGQLCLPQGASEGDYHFSPSLKKDRGDWEQLAETVGALYGQGVKLDWLGWEKDCPPRRKLDLPSYPFQRKRCWVEADPRSASRADLNPLLGRRIDSAVRNETVFEAEYGAAAFPLVVHHRLHGKIAIAGAAHISRALLAGRELFGEVPLAVEDVEFLQPLIIGETETRLSQLVLESSGSGEFSFRILSRRKPGKGQLDPGDWVTHVVGRLASLPSDARPEKPETTELEQVRGRCTVSYAGAKVNRLLDGYGIARGEKFAGVRQLWCGQSEAVSRLWISDEDDRGAGAYLLHPGLIDSFFQTVMGADDLEKPLEDAHLPYGVRRFAFFRSAKSVWCSTISVKSGSADKARLNHFKVYDEQGNVVAEIEGYASVYAPRDALFRGLSDADELEDALYEVGWREKRHSEASPAGGSGAQPDWLIVRSEESRGELSQRLACEIEAVGGKARIVEFASEGDRELPELLPKVLRNVLEDALKKGLPKRIVHLACAEEEAGDAASLEQAQKRGYLSVLETVKTLLAVPGASESPLFVVTRGAQGVSGKEASLDPRQAPVWGLGRVVLQEYAELRCTLIDLDPGRPDPAEEARLIHGEAGSGESEPQVAFRRAAQGYGRYVARLVRARRAEPAPLLKPEAAYLITGGLSGLGLQSASWMVESGARHLILMARGEPGEEAKKTIQRLEKAGARVRICRGDVSDPGALARVLSENEGSPPVQGVIHAAGVLEDGTLAQQDWSKFLKVMGPKVLGAWNLHLATQSLPLDFFVLFSSAASVMGTAGQGNYAAANAFMDTLAHLRRLRGLTATSVNWGPWADVGMAARMDEQKRKQLFRTGLGTIPLAPGMRCLGSALAFRGAQFAVLPINWDQFARSAASPEATRFFAELMPAAPAQAASSPPEQAESELVEKLARVTAAERTELIVRFLSDEAARILGLDSSTSLVINQGLMDLGMDSLSGVEFRNRIRKALGEKLGRRVPSTLIFDHPTIESVAKLLLNEVLSFVKLPASQAPEKTLEKKRRAASTALPGEPVAIVGMACRFPGGAVNLPAFWRVLADGVDATQEIPAERWDVDGFFDPKMDTPGKMYVKRGAFLTDVDRFDPQFFNISLDEASLMDPQQRLLHEVTWEAIENAGESVEEIQGTRTGIWVGVSYSDYADIVKSSARSGDSQGLLGNLHGPAAGHLSYFLGAQGPSVAIDTLCSSSLVAIHQACQSLRSGSCERAIAAGVNLNLTPELYLFLSGIHALSPEGVCRTFDASANGFARGEGCGALVLKRLSAAVADGDRVWAVIRGTAVNHNGRSSSLTAPNGAVQEALIREALEDARVKPAEVSYVEAHGTGTPLGDPIEVQALGRVLREGRSPDNPLVIGSVKTNIGHAEPAAGMAGVIKTVLSMHHGKIPAHLHFKSPNPNLGIEEIPAVVPSRMMDWTPSGGKRVAGVSAFGLTGTNSHVVLEDFPGESPARKAGAEERPVQLLTLSARDPGALESSARNFSEAMGAWEESRLGDACYTASACRTHFEERLAVTGRTREELQGRLRTFLSGKGGPGIVRGRVSGKGSAPKVAFLFSGQGSQYLGMSQELYGTQPGFRRSIDRCEDILRSYLKAPLREVLFGGGKGEDAGRKAVDAQDALMHRTEYTQPALFALEYSLAELWKSWGVEPQAVLGHSVGELVAACVAGVFSLEDGLKLISARAGLMQKLPGHGQMGAVSASVERVREAIAPYAKTVSIAAINAPGSVTVAGESGDLRKVLAGFEEQGVKVKLLTVSHAFHSPQMDGMLDEFEQVAGQISYRAPQIRVISNLHGRKAEGEELGQPGYWRRHVREAVRFSEGMGALLADGYRHFMEVGPGTTLSALGQLCLPQGASEGDYHFSPSLKKDRGDWEQLAETVGALYGQGVKLDWLGWEKDCPPRRKLDLPSYPFQRKRCWVEGVGKRSFSRSAAETDSKAADRRKSILKRLQMATGSEQDSILREFVESTLRSTLAIGHGTDLDAQRDLSEYGMDSLGALALARKLKAGLEGRVDLSSTALFENPTIERLVPYLKERVLGTPGGSLSRSADGTGGRSDSRSDGALQRWIRSRTPRPEARLRLFCLNYAGGAAQTFNPWFNGVPDWLEICPIQLPGRWERNSEPLIPDMSELVRALDEGIRPALERPYALLGYSFGATLGFELMRHLRKQGGPLPRAFFPVASPAPHLLAGLRKPGPSADQLTDQGVLERFQAAVGVFPGRLMEDEDARKLFIPVLRADLAALESHRYQEEAPLEVAIRAFGGTRDVWATRESIAAWKAHSTRSVPVELLEGDHFFLHAASGIELVRRLVAQLERLTPGE